MSSRLAQQQEGCVRRCRFGMCNVLAAFLAAVLLGGGVPAPAGFIPGATTMTPIPDGKGMFTGVSSPSISDGVVAFYGKGKGGQNGVYVGVPGQKSYNLVKVADTNTPIPNGKGKFRSFSDELGGTEPSASQGGKLVAFSANGGRGLYIGVKGVNGYQVSLVADTSTKIPNMNGKFVAFGSPVLSGNKIVFEGFSGTRGKPIAAGIYTAVPNGKGYTVIPAADTNTKIPGENKNFAAFGAYPSISSNRVLFAGGTEGSSRLPGLYLGTLNAKGTGFDVIKVADTSTPIPKGGGGNFAGFAFNPALSNGVAVFRGNGEGRQQGVYLGLSDNKGGYTISSVADTQTRVPGTMGDFSDFLPASISGNTVVFSGSGGGKNGLFMRTFTPNPFKLSDLKPLVLSGDTDHGITLKGTLFFTHAGFDGKQATFQSSFTSAAGSGGQGIFVTTTPEPTSLILFAIGFAGLAGYGWRRRMIG